MTRRDQLIADLWLLTGAIPKDDFTDEMLTASNRLLIFIDARSDE